MIEDGGERGSATSPARVHEAALRLFARHGVGSTSLQMIADELGVTKAALYYRYRTKDELVAGVLDPFLRELSEVAAAAAARRGPRARVEAVLDGLVDVVVRGRGLYVVLAGDPSLADLHHPLLQEVGAQLVAVLAGEDADEARRITVALFLSGLIGPLQDSAVRAVPDEVLRATLLEVGRRLLLPRRSPRG